MAGSDDARGFVHQVLSMNEYQQQRFCNNIVQTMVNVKGKKIALMGFAYKPNTSDCRHSPAIDIAKAMIAEGAHLAVFDPQVRAEVVIDALGNVPTLQVRPSPCLSARWAGGDVRAGCALLDSHCSSFLQVTMCKSAIEAAEGADAIVLVTDWECFSTLDMQHGGYMFSCRLPCSSERGRIRSTGQTLCVRACVRACGCVGPSVCLSAQVLLMRDICAVQPSLVAASVTACRQLGPCQRADPHLHV